ncbi:aminotransferase class I/II-fold pyridoxal phosphate-dependent enzyme [Vibrio hannami]|uniref:pyridoxal phosphate-dependent aminotransferase n=1 Tax=Vibrio hannami TaxID=2717094 RepID=UPI00240FA2D9|nr:aminotransferase class I/II-fold pyridoxal phosphate-dependent enzyme [Vibrio hannami]MDG3087762.1 aminotransferase class I/II-fold pyridoxal phosphate-dependent enzyme [Vibrio hannami]
MFSQRNQKIDTENAFKVGPHISAIEKQGHSVVKLNLGEPDFDIPKPIEDEVIRQLRNNNTHYCDPKGLPALRMAIAKQICETRQLDVSPDQVVVFPGGKPSIGFAQQVYCDPGDEIIYPSPGFPIYESFIDYVGAVAKPLHLSEDQDFSFTAEQLDSLITDRTKLIYINFPSNPTGGIASEEQLKAIAEVINRRCGPEVRVYSDEIYEYITFDGKKHISIATMPGMAERTIIASGMSKTFAWTGGRIGYAVFPTVEEADTFKNLNINYFSCVPPYNQQGAVVALENPDVMDTVRKMVDTFEERRDWIYSALNAIDGISTKKPGGAFYIFPNISKVCESLGVIDAFNNLPGHVQETTSPSTLFQMFALYHHHVAVMDRRSFGKIDVEGKHYLRLSYAAEMSQLQEGIKRIEAATKDKAGFAEFISKGKNFC